MRGGDGGKGMGVKDLTGIPSATSGCQGQVPEESRKQNPLCMVNHSYNHGEEMPKVLTHVARLQHSVMLTEQFCPKLTPE